MERECAWEHALTHPAVVIYTAGKRSAHIYHITFGVFVVYLYWNFYLNAIANLCVCYQMYFDDKSTLHIQNIPVTAFQIITWLYN